MPGGLFSCFSSSNAVDPGTRANGVAEENLQRATLGAGPSESAPGLRRAYSAWGSETEGQAGALGRSPRRGTTALDNFGPSVLRSPELADDVDALGGPGDIHAQSRPHSPSAEPTSNVMLSGEELRDVRGFTSHSAQSMATLDRRGAPPVTFMVLDIIKSNLRHKHKEPLSDNDGEGNASVRKYRNRLVPIFTNTVCRNYFKIDSVRDYVEVLKKLLKRDPLLTFALQKAVRHLKAGDPKHVSHVTPDPSGQTSSLIGMRITPCVWTQHGRTFPALMFEHDVAYNPAVVMPRLMRDYAVLSHVPAILTLIDFQGKVLYQNASSLEYMGDLLSGKYDRHLSDGLLQVLYSCDLSSLEQMLDNVLRNQEWQGVVQVPYSMWKHLGQQQDPDTVIDYVEFSSSSLPRDELGHHRPGSNVGFVLKQASAVPVPSDSMSRRAQSLRALPPGAEASSFSFGGDAVESRQASISAAVHELGGPSLQQRKFVALLGGGSQRPAGGLASVPGGTGSEEGSASEQDSDGGDEGEEDDELDEDIECYHEIHAIPLLDPVLDKQVIMLVQTDVTPRVELENKLADLTDAQLSMLEELFPRHIIEYMLAREPSRGNRNLRGLANMHDKVMVLFCDVVGFTSMSKEVEASQVMNFLNELYQTFDDLVDDYGMYKLDIVGDCYIVVAGLIKEDQDGFVCVDELNENEVASNASRIMQFAKAMLRESQPVLMPHNLQPVSLRIGIHTGPLVSGLVGSKMPKFTLFGDTMNTASRMETTCRPNCVHVSEAFAKLVPNEDWESTGGVQVKGKGLMLTALWVPKPEAESDTIGDDLERSLRHNASGASFASSGARSRVTGRSMSRKPSLSGAPPNEAPDNPLMAILSNIRMGDSIVDDTASTVSTMRPKQGKQAGGGGRTRINRSSDGNGLSVAPSAAPSSRALSDHPSIASRASSHATGSANAGDTRR